MEEAWERAVESALGNQPNPSMASPPRTLTLDGAVKCLHGRLPQSELLGRYQSLQHLSIANVGVSSLEKFPRLRNLERLILSDNRIAGGLEFLVEAGLDSLRDLDLSNNRIQFLEDLAPLAQLRLVSLDLYECPVTRIKDYRSRVFGMIRTLKYLDKMDADENERPETDEEDEEDEEVDEEDDPGSGEVDGGDRPVRAMNGVRVSTIGGGVVDVDDDEEESDGVEEELETGEDHGSHHQLSNGFRVTMAGPASVDIEEDEEEEDVDDEEEDEEEDLGEEIDEQDGEEEDVIEVHDVRDSDEEEEEEGDDDEEDVEDGEYDGELGSTGKMTSTEGEIDEDEQGEDDENGEIGEEDEQVMEEYQEYEEGDCEDEDAEEDLGTEYLLQPISQIVDEAAGSDFDACDVEDEDEDDVDDEDDDEEGQHGNGDMQQFSLSDGGKRKRDDLDDDSVEELRASKHH
ncbi:uncharacterized protein [Typha latifolia]|uniref:uncharacterized protein n=1 Tax=Typha latifolia TaxID=4733 RepID=UPI003C2C25E9